ncbi:Phosphomannomutase/phosphoglucomutase [Prosthecochloris sp. CIB 2401]|nr:Phosphomannomutase/phosphoglucomutase [Prosthecochloris sp. CIB 2401]
MVSVSGVRGIVGESLTPRVLSSFSQAFATWIRGRMQGVEGAPVMVVGRDTRPTGAVISQLVCSTLALCGCRVVDLGIATTPTVELAVTGEEAQGGIIITASHNPLEWNALKLLNQQGEFLDEVELEELLCVLREEKYALARWDGVGTITGNSSYDAEHIRQVLGLSCVDRSVIERQGFRVLVDAVEGAGSFIVPELCRALGIDAVETVACGGTGIFPRNPEPVAENLMATIEAMQERSCDFAIVVDPDVDRLALICEDGSLFGEEYTLVVCADFYLQHRPGTVVNNLSSSRALHDIAMRHGQQCLSAKVGEANVTALMKSANAVIGGEGNGGVILPELHYGRDALAGIGLFVQAFAAWRERSAGEKCLSAFRSEYPRYVMIKRKVRFDAGRENLDLVFHEIADAHPDAHANMQDGLKLDFEDSWVHMRSSNTEPILRIYIEAPTAEEAERLAGLFCAELEERIEEAEG